MSGAERREKILQLLTDAEKPLSGASIAEQLSVSRQVIVQDIALLRANGEEIIATTNGYLLNKKNAGVSRVFKVYHTEADAEQELNLIIDCGGWVKDVFIYHKIYGIVRAEINIKTRKDIKAFIGKINEGKSTFLMNATSGYHYHTVIAENETIMNEIHSELSAGGFIAPLQDWEPQQLTNI